MPSMTTHPRRPVPRLNVPPSERMWGVESLHGVRLGHCPGQLCYQFIERVE